MRDDSRCALSFVPLDDEGYLVQVNLLAGAIELHTDPRAHWRLPDRVVIHLQLAADELLETSLEPNRQCHADGERLGSIQLDAQGARSRIVVSHYADCTIARMMRSDAPWLESLDRLPRGRVSRVIAA